MKRREAALLIAADRSFLGALLGGLVNVAAGAVVLTLLLIAGWTIILWWWLPPVVHTVIKLGLLAALLVGADRVLLQGRGSRWLHRQVRLRHRRT